MILKNKAEKFYNGYLFPVCIGFIVALCHIYNLLHLGVLLTVLLCGAGFLACKDLRFFICPLLCLYFIISVDTLNDESLYGTPSLIFLTVCIFVLLACIAAHFIIYRKEISLKSFKESILRNGFILISLLFVANGALSFRIYNATNFIFGILIAISFILPFFLFSINLKMEKDTADYLIWVLIVVTGVIAAEFINLYINDVVVTERGVILKGSIILGWGVSNNIGAILAMLMPAFFYKTTKSRLSVLYFIGGITVYFLIIMTLSRAAILFATACFVCCLAFLCIYKHKSRLIIGALTLVIFAAAFAIVAYHYESIKLALHQVISAGFDDSKRLEYYKDGINKFFEHPILGAGFGNSHGVNNSFVIEAPQYFHNTIVQVLASCGILGFIAYAYHRFETVKLLIKNRNPLSFFIAMMIGTLLLTSLLDIHMFNIFPAFFYSVILCIFERSSRELVSVPADKCKASETDEK